MTDWVLLLTPLLVLPIVVLFRFVGCGTLLTAEDEPELPVPERPRYRDYIMGVPREDNPGKVLHTDVTPDVGNVVGYWRLVDALGATDATDEKGFQKGTYKTVPPNPDDLTTFSQHATGGFDAGTALIVSDDQRKCRFFNGGYALVDYKPGLYPPQFTIEAWVQVGWGTNVSFDHTLFDAGGVSNPGTPTETISGFRVHVNKNNQWQVNIAGTPGGVFVPDPPAISLFQKTHVAVTMQNAGAQKRVRIFIDGVLKGEALVAMYSPATGSPLYIGVANTRPVPLADPEPVRRAMLCQIQEVVIHRTVLSDHEIENHFWINR